MPTVRSGASTDSASSRQQIASAVSTTSGNGGWVCGSGSDVARRNFLSAEASVKAGSCADDGAVMMRTRTIAVGPLGILVCAAIFGGVATRSLIGQGQPGSVAPAALSDEFQQTVLPVLAKNCIGCHSERLHSGNL